MHEDSCNWVKWFDPLLFAVWEAPQASVEFSPFEPSGKGPFWSHGALGMLTMMWCILTGVRPHKFTTSTSLKPGGRWRLFLWLPQWSRGMSLEKRWLIHWWPSLAEPDSRCGLVAEAPPQRNTPGRSWPYRLMEQKRNIVRAELQAMLEMGIIEKSNSDRCSNIVLVHKSDGSIWFCVDYRRVNKVSKFDAYPMPRVNELLDRLGMARFYTTLDLTKGYWQIPLSLESREKMAVTLPFGLFWGPSHISGPHGPGAAATLCICCGLLGWCNQS